MSVKLRVIELRSKIGDRRIQELPIKLFFDPAAILMEDCPGSELKPSSERGARRMLTALIYGEIVENNRAEIRMKGIEHTRDWK